MHVYMDLVLILNFLVDFLLLYGTNKLAGFSGSWKRTALAALLGAGYAAGCFLPGCSFLAEGIWPFAVLAAMAGIAFGFCKSGVRRGVVFFLLSMALGGISTGLGSMGAWALVLAGAGLWLMCLLGFGGGKLGSTYMPVTICYGDKQVVLTALVDTGNTLKDPLSGVPVLVADSQAAQKLMALTPRDLENPLKTITSGRYKGLRLIPYHAVGTAGGMLLGIKPDICLANGRKMDYIVAFAPQKIGQGKPYEALAGGSI